MAFKVLRLMPSRCHPSQCNGPQVFLCHLCALTEPGGCEKNHYQLSDAELADSTFVTSALSQLSASACTITVSPVFRISQ